jgi:hypothetical protein
MFIDGTQVGSTYSDSNDYKANDYARIGSASDNPSGLNYFNGYISNLRIVDGTAVYTSAFTPSTAPLTAISGTALLTLQGPEPFIDNSGNSLAIAQLGNVKAQNFGPFTSDEAGAGGLVWLKRRDGVAAQHFQFDTERGTGPYLVSNSTAAATADAGFHISSYNANGFSLQGNGIGTNNTSYDYASWTFRKAEKFFDVVTYTGTGSAQTIAHNLGVAPAFIITKKTSSTSNWATNDPSQANPWSGALLLNSPNAFTTASTVWNDTAPTDSVFTVGTSDATNVSGQTYVAYLFASDAGGFGDDGSESIIKCGSYTGNGSTDGPEIDCGFEPQFLLLKSSTLGGGANWLIYDNMRGFVTGGDDAYLRPNLSDAEGLFESGEFLANGFKLKATDGSLNGSGENYIYIAIRRPMKTPESGTEVFTPTFGTGSGFNFIAGFPVDMAIIKDKGSVVTSYASARLNSGTLLATASTAAEITNAPAVFDSQVGYYESSLGSTYIGWLFKRATGFFDVVAYTGDKVSEGGPQTITHNLKVVPDLVIVKERSNSDPWYTASTELNNYDYLTLNTTNQVQSNSVTPYVYDLAVNTFKVGPRNQVNATGDTYIAYLFATLAGVSKVGSYTGTTGSNVDVDCGFSAGARFILIKRTSGAGDWYVYDSERGIVAGNDPYILANTDAAQVTNTDWIDPLSSGFTVTSSGGNELNDNGSTYIFLAIA